MFVMDKLIKKNANNSTPNTLFSVKIHVNFTNLKMRPGIRFTQLEK